MQPSLLATDTNHPFRHAHSLTAPRYSAIVREYARSRSFIASLSGPDRLSPNAGIPSVTSSSTSGESRSSCSSTTAPTALPVCSHSSPKQQFHTSFSSSVTANASASTTTAGTSIRPSHSTTASACGPTNGESPPGSSGAPRLGTAKNSSPRVLSASPRCASQGRSIPFWVNTSRW